MAAPVSFRERSDSFPLHRSPRPYMGPISGSHQGPQPERLHLEAGYMAAPVSFRERSDSFPLHRGRRPYMADFVAKVPKYQATTFFENKEAKLSSPINMAPRPLAKSPVSFSLGDEVPHRFIRVSRQRHRKILISGGKRLLQQIGTTRKRLAARIDSANWGEADRNAAVR